MALDFTIAIPTYNGAARLPAVFERLRSQQDVEHLAWEILVVDNNSSDETAAVVRQYQNENQLPVPLRYCQEMRQGAAYARQRAMVAAEAEWIGFLDDDNLPDVHWLAVADRFRRDRPKLAAFSGRIHGSYEAEPPPNFEQIQEFLAIRDHGDQPLQFQPETLILPPAASLVIRRQAWRDHVPQRPLLGGKLPGGLLVQGDDYEPLLYLHKAGWEIWYVPDLQTYHQIPKWRFEPSYLVKIARGCGLATCQLRMITAVPAQKPLIWLRTLLGGTKRTVLYWLQHRRQWQTDPIVRSQLAFHVGSLISPWFYLRCKLTPRSDIKT